MVAATEKSLHFSLNIFQYFANMTESTGALTKKVASGSPYQLDNDQVCSVLDDKKRQKNKKIKNFVAKQANLPSNHASSVSETLCRSRS